MPVVRDGCTTSRRMCVLARLLAKERSLTVVAVLALALGIGVNNTLFSVVSAICLRGLPIADPNRVVDISERDQAAPDPAALGAAV